MAVAPSEIAYNGERDSHSREIKVVVGCKRVDEGQRACRTKESLIAVRSHICQVNVTSVTLRFSLFYSTSTHLLTTHVSLYLDPEAGLTSLGPRLYAPPITAVALSPSIAGLPLEGRARWHRRDVQHYQEPRVAGEDQMNDLGQEATAEPPRKVGEAAAAKTPARKPKRKNSIS
ncbi:hypothetical protein K438DRAFT_1939890 [Mycena galopus ATCC 62051]|nr:hypothetical protein K438DRAFT_1939890 [Mycena galopus ATCC 62051]